MSLIHGHFSSLVALVFWSKWPCLHWALSCQCCFLIWKRLASVRCAKKWNLLLAIQMLLVCTPPYRKHSCNLRVGCPTISLTLSVGLSQHTHNLGLLLCSFCKPFSMLWLTDNSKTLISRCHALGKNFKGYCPKLISVPT